MQAKRWRLTSPEPRWASQDVRDDGKKNPATLPMAMLPLHSRDEAESAHLGSKIFEAPLGHLAPDRDALIYCKSMQALRPHKTSFGCVCDNALHPASRIKSRTHRRMASYAHKSRVSFIFADLQDGGDVAHDFSKFNKHVPPIAAPASAGRHAKF